MIHVPPPKPARGGAPVGLLADLPPVEAAAILYLRQWFCADKAQVSGDFRLALGAADGEVAANCFADLMALLQRRARRPVLHHQPRCACIGGDESAFAQLVAAAAEGDEHAASTFALHLFDAGVTRQVLGCAGMCGLALHAMAAMAPAQHNTTPVDQAGPRTLH